MARHLPPLALAFLALLLTAAPAWAVDLRLVDGETGEPLANATIRIGDAEAASDADGLVEVDVEAEAGDEIAYVVAYTRDGVQHEARGSFRMPSAATDLVTVAVPPGLPVSPATRPSPAAGAEDTVTAGSPGPALLVDPRDADLTLWPVDGQHADDDELREAYQDLERIRDEAARVREELEQELEAYRALRDADEAVAQATARRDETRVAQRMAEQAARRAQELREGRQITQQAENAARAAHTRARQDAERAEQARNDAISDRLDVLDDHFADQDGRRLTPEEIEQRRRAIDDRLEQLEQAERAASDRVDNAYGTVREPSLRALDGLQTTLKRAGNSAVVALADLTQAIEQGDTDQARIGQARARVQDAMADLAGIADAAAFDAVFGDPSPTLQTLGEAARADLNRIAEALDQANAALTGRSTGIEDSPDQAVPGTVRAVDGPAGPGPGQTPAARVQDMPPLVQDLIAQVGGRTSADGVSVSRMRAWLSTVADRSLQQFGDNELWFTRLYPEERAFLFLLHRMRLYELAGRMALWNQMLPGSGDVPPGHLVQAAVNGTLPEFVEGHINLEAAPGSLIAPGQPDTPEFRQRRQQIDDALVAQAVDYHRKVEAAAQAEQTYKDTVVRANAMPAQSAYAAAGISEEAAAEFMERREEARRALPAAERARRLANSELAAAERDLVRQSVLRQYVDHRRLHEILVDPEVGADEKRAAIDEAIALDLERMADVFTRIREIDSFEELAEETLDPSLAPMQQYVLAVLKEVFGDSAQAADTWLGHLGQIFELNVKDIRLSEGDWDVGYMAANLGLAVLTLAALILAPEVAIPVLLFGLGSAGAGTAAVEYADRADRAEAARAELAAVQERVASGQLTDASVLTAAQERVAEAERQEDVALALAVVSLAAGAADGVQATAATVRALGTTADAVDAVADAAVISRATDAIDAAPSPSAAGLPGVDPPAAGPRGPPVTVVPPTGTATGRAPAPARLWSAADEEALRLGMTNPSTASEAVSRLDGAQLPFAQSGGHAGAIIIRDPIQTGGFGSVLSADLVPAGGELAGVTRASTAALDGLGVPVTFIPLSDIDGRVVVKLFDNGEEGLDALRGELQGAAFFEEAGVPYARYVGWGVTPDGTPYVLKEFIDTSQAAGRTLTPAQQQATVDGFAAMARAGGVPLDAKPDNTFFRPIVNADGTEGVRWAQYEGDFAGSVAGTAADDAPERFANPLAGLFGMPDQPRFALGSGFRPVESLKQLDLLQRLELQENAWIGNIVQAERARLLDFDLGTRTFRSGTTDIALWRNHPEFGPALQEYESLLQSSRGAEGVAGGSGATTAGRVADAAASGGEAAAAASSGRVGSAVDDIQAALEAASQGASASVRTERIVIRLAHVADDAAGTPSATGPFRFVTDTVPGGWSQVEDVVEVPATAGGGWLVTLSTRVPDAVRQALEGNPRVAYVESDKETRAQADPPDDPFYASRGSWGQPEDDQWGLKRIGFLPSGRAPLVWDLAGEARRSVIVAVIDSGLDYFHPDLSPSNLWRNTLELPNERDDDGNGYVDDLIGWNFVAENDTPWDDLGHGTHVAGVIAAATGNGTGIAGINPRARIMPLKVLDATGRGHASDVAEAVFYAVRHGALVINLSLGERTISETERLAVEYARRSGAVVVVAAGNAAGDTAAFGPAGLSSAITVSATDPGDRRLGFSNWGHAVKVAAPGVDVLSLRAERTDLNLAMGVQEYVAGSNVAGADERYYRASGTSFAAPFVTGVASLLLSRDPDLTAEQVERMILMSADDVEVPGWDQYTGYGRLNAALALQADPDWYLDARVTTVQPVQKDGAGIIQVVGTVTGSDLREYDVQLGQGDAPETWTDVVQVEDQEVSDGILGEIPFSAITARGTWTIRVLARDGQGREREARGELTVE